MNLTGRPVYQKGQKRKSRAAARAPNAAERRHWDALLKLGCILAGRIAHEGFECQGRVTIHHCGTGGGGRKDHLKVLPLCWEHHLGAKGIDGKRMSKRQWQETYGTEDELLEMLHIRLNQIEGGSE